MTRYLPPGSRNPKIDKFAEKYGVTREAAGMALHMLKNGELKLDEHVYKTDLPINTLWRVEHLLGILKTCERAGLYGDPGLLEILGFSHLYESTQGEP